MNFFKLKRKIANQNSQGFTLIEILMVTFISGMVFIGIYSLFSSTIKYDIESRNEVVASNLAQEGIEMIRNVRDTDYLRASKSSTGAVTYSVDTDTNLNSGTYIPYQTNGTVSLGSDSSTNRKVQILSDFYSNCSSSCTGTETSFQRWVTITNSSSSDHLVKIECTVQWTNFASSGLTRTLNATSILGDWKQK